MVRSSAAAGAAALLLAVAGCGGGAEAPETVSPTAGADPAPSDQIYEPTLPPYTSEVDLSADDIAVVESTLGFIEEYFHFTSDFTESNNIAVESLAANDVISEGLRDAHFDAAESAAENNQVITGSIRIADAAVWEFERDEFGYFGVCLEFDKWGLVDEKSRLTADGETSPPSKKLLAELQAHYEGDSPVLQNLRFDDEKNECTNL